MQRYGLIRGIYLPKIDKQSQLDRLPFFLEQGVSHSLVCRLMSVGGASGPLQIPLWMTLKKWFQSGKPIPIKSLTLISPGDPQSNFGSILNSLPPLDSLTIKAHGLNASAISSIQSTVKTLTLCG